MCVCVCVCVCIVVCICFKLILSCCCRRSGDADSAAFGMDCLARLPPASCSLCHNQWVQTWGKEETRHWDQTVTAHWRTYGCKLLGGCGSFHGDVTMCSVAVWGVMMDLTPLNIVRGVTRRGCWINNLKLYCLRLRTNRSYRQEKAVSFQSRAHTRSHYASWLWSW